MKLNLNLATRPLENKRSFLALAVLAGAIEIVALAVLFHAAYDSWRSSRELRAEIGGYQAQIRADYLRHQQLKAFFMTPKATEVLGRAAFLNSLIDERGFPWTKVFMDIEQTLPPGVRVVSIAPRLENTRAKVTLVVGADNDQDMVKFLQSLETSKAFSGVAVQEEHYIVKPTSTDKVEALLTVWYETT